MNLLRRPLAWPLLAAILLLVACGAGKPENFAERFYQTVADGDTDKAVQMFSYKDVKDVDMTSARGKATVIVGQMEATFRTAGGLKKLNVDNVARPNDDTADVAVTLRLGNGSERRDSLRLVREGGSWKVHIR